MRAALLFALLLAVSASALAKPPSWDRRIDSPKRFKVLKAFDSDAVLDQETGVVWARSVSLTGANWTIAIAGCANELIGGRYGWRLPTVFELRALIDPDSRSLPAGHPFETPDGLYWTSTTTPSDVASAFIGDVGSPASSVAIGSKSEAHDVWCVRGGGATIEPF